MTEWQPIETAPRNKAIIVCDGRSVGEACLIAHEDDFIGWYWADEHSKMVHEPAVWMPLPAPPSWMLQPLPSPPKTEEAA